MALLLTNPKTGRKFILKKKPPMPPKTLGSKYVKKVSTKKRA
jgi:hypothetical protein